MKRIIEGFTNYALSFARSSDSEIEKEAKRRLDICDTCEFRTGVWCGDCGCYLPSKSRSKSMCEHKKWDV